MLRVVRFILVVAWYQLELKVVGIQMPAAEEKQSMLLIDCAAHACVLSEMLVMKSRPFLQWHRNVSRPRISWARLVAHPDRVDLVEGCS